MEEGRIHQGEARQSLLEEEAGAKPWRPGKEREGAQPDRWDSASSPGGPWDLLGPFGLWHGWPPFSYSFGSLLPSAAAPSTTTGWRRSSLALSPGSLWSTWPCPFPSSTGCTQLPPSSRSIVRSSPHSRGRPRRGASRPHKSGRVASVCCGCLLWVGWPIAPMGADKSGQGSVRWLKSV